MENVSHGRLIVALGVGEGDERHGLNRRDPRIDGDIEVGGREIPVGGNLGGDLRKGLPSARREGFGDGRRRYKDWLGQSAFIRRERGENGYGRLVQSGADDDGCARNGDGA